MDIILNADALRAVADILPQYAARQTEIIDCYRSKIEAIGSEWQDDQTFLEMYHTVCTMQQTLADAMEKVIAASKYFSQKADALDARPSLEGQNRTSVVRDTAVSVGGGAKKEKEQEDAELPSLSAEAGVTLLNEYLSRNGYGPDDYALYSQDPEWRGLMALAYPETELPPYVGKKTVSALNITDLTAARQDVQMAKVLLAEYRIATEEKGAKKNDTMRKHLESVLLESEATLSAVERGQPYLLERQSEYWDTPEGERVIGFIAKHVSHLLSKTLSESFTEYISEHLSESHAKAFEIGWDTATDSCKESYLFLSSYFMKKVLKKAPDLLENMANTFVPAARREFEQKFFLRDEDGNPITSEDAARLSRKKGGSTDG